jgi:flagellar basal-body rod modification protein FlgD
MTAIHTGAMTASSTTTTDAPPRQAVNVGDAAQMENTFITLMTAQIRNQDPTKPLDSGEFLNQFAAMSQVKSMENMAALTRNNLIVLDNLQTLTAAGLVGQEVKVAAERIVLDGSPLKGQLNQEHASGQTLLRLTDMTGKRTEIRLGAQGPGAVPFEFDPVAHGLAPGRYLIEAETDGGEYPKIELAGRVNHVRVSEEGPVLEVEGIGPMPFYKITEFGRTDTASL